MGIQVNIGDVFYRVEPTDFKHYYRTCRVCEGKRDITVNGITFKCPMCQSESEVLRVRGYFVRRYRLYSIEKFISNQDWKYDGKEPLVRYEIYHKSGLGHSFSNNFSTRKVSSDMFSGDCRYFNNQDANEYSVDSCLYSDYKLAVAVAERLTQEQIDKVRAYNIENGTDYALPVFTIEHDKKSK